MIVGTRSVHLCTGAEQVCVVMQQLERLGMDLEVFCAYHFPAAKALPRKNYAKNDIFAILRQCMRHMHRIYYM